MAGVNFVTDGPSEVWKKVLSLYGDVLKTKSEKINDKSKRNLLIELDDWYQNELPQSLKSRKPMQLSHKELSKLMKWKLTRGKFRPRLEQLVQTNTEESVEKITQKAFEALPDAGKAVKILCDLKAVGPATASAILAAGCPEEVAFMADESMASFPGLLPLQYTLAFFKAYMLEVESVVKRLSAEDKEGHWTPHKVELTLWAYHLLKTLSPEKLSEVLEENPVSKQEETKSEKRKLAIKPKSPAKKKYKK